MVSSWEPCGGGEPPLCPTRQTNLPLTWAVKGGAGGGGGRAWGPTGTGVQWTRGGVCGELGPRLLRLGLLAGVWVNLSLQG
jgi:hypothetical protein